MYLLTRVAPRASLSVGLQILRKATLAFELAWASSCALGCGAVAAGRKVAEFISEAMQGIAGAMDVLGAIGESTKQGVSTLFVAPILTLRAELNPENHRYSPELPQQLRTDLAVLLYYLWNRLNPSNLDEFIPGSQRELNTFSIPPALLGDVAMELQSFASRKSQLTVEVTSTLLSSQSPIGFVRLLRLLTALRFVEAPAVLGEREAGAN